MAESIPRSIWRSKALISKKAITLFLILALVLVALFEISLPLDFGGVEVIQAPDPVVEENYAACYQEKDGEMHRAVFGAIDNPDVQREMISTNRERIARECRQSYPQKMITAEQQTPLNLIELKPRLW